MGKKKLTRKEFLSITGAAGIVAATGKMTVKPGNFTSLRPLGKTGIMVSPLCFGAPRTNEVSLIKYAIGKGINFIDTGRAYGNGNNEKLVGQAVSGTRDKVVIQSKIRLERNELPSGGKGRKGAEEIRQALSSKFEASLKALNSVYIDILLIHDAIEEELLFHSETLKFFSELKKSGSVKACGFSTHNDYMNLPAKNNSEQFYDVIMLPFNPKGSFVHSVTGNYSEWDQEKLISILTEAGQKGIGVVAMKTCSGGKHSIAPGNDPDFVQSVEWVIKHDFISSAAVAMANFEQVDEHIRLLG
ncbi:MAG TPA: aldo/keto reductase [Bacteroidales bacterium]|jgi:aryl-alcohol dehydrogenase-like predicted oxidoreductase|nr:aldo/keto reductase [Bacteroidales bacterium]